MNSLFKDEDLLAEKYYLLLCDALFAVEKSKRYLALSEEYKTLLCEINEILNKTDSPITDAARLIDKETGKIKPGAEAFLDSSKLSFLLAELSELYIKMLGIYPGLQGELNCNLNSVLAISAYSEMEKEIIKAFGKSAGERIIYEQKKRVLAFEEKLGMEFFAPEVLKYEAIEKIRFLDFDGQFNPPKRDSLAEGRILLKKGGMMKTFPKTWIPMRNWTRSTIRNCTFQPDQ